MIKVKKTSSLAIVAFLILSNIAFAISSDTKFEFEENFVMKSEVSEEQMRSMAKAKFGDKFSEMEFRKGMNELEERMKRKETFSYEHEGYQNSYYHPGPSYEGYSKEHMIFGMVFEQIGDDIDPREIKQYCREPEKIVDLMISKLKEKTGDIQKLCSRMGEQEAKCAEHSKKDCSRIGMPFVRDGATEMEKLESAAYSCPPNKDAIIEACKKRSISYMENRIENADEECKRRFDFEGERLLRECDKFRESNACDKEKFMDKCMGGVKRRDFDEDENKHTKVCDVSDCGPQLRMPNTPCPDGKTSSGPTGRCLRHDNGRCGWEITKCPSKQGCTEEAKICPDGSFVGRVPPSCEFAPCLAPTIKCPPPPSSPSCPEGTTSKPTYDTNGCLIGHECEQKQQPYGCDAIVTKPTCNADETLQTYYDSAGCVSKYECIKHTTTCPEIQKPTCTEGQSLTAKYDDNGCVVGYDCVTVTTSTSNATVTGSAIRITGRAVSSTYDEFLRRCEGSWSRQQSMCERMEGQGCDKSSFIDKCAEMEKRNYQDFSSKIGHNCESQTTAEIEHAEQRCSRIEEDRQRCSEDAAKRCERMKGLASQCRELLTEENLRKFIVEEANKRCRFTGIIEDEEQVRRAEKVEVILAVLNTATKGDIEKLGLFVNNLKEELRLQDTTVYKGIIEPKMFGDIKLLSFVVNAKISAIPSSETAKESKARIVASQKVGEAAGRLASLRDSGVPSQFLYIIEDKASDVLNVSGNLEDIEKKEEQKGVGYKIKLFLGLAKEAEKVEIRQLEDSREKLRASIEALTKLADEVPSDVAKAVLKKQVESLKEQQENIDVLIGTKEKKSKGLFGLFG